jgi:CubicO group peptidase (beta-lactamase class C family)
MPLDLENVWRSLDERVASGWAPGIVAGVRHRGETRLYATGSYDLAGTRRMTEDSPFRIASLSKIVGMVLAAELINDGVLELDDEIRDWIPELGARRVLSSPGTALEDTVPARREITVRDLLTFTSSMGLEFEDTPYSREVNPYAVGPLPPQLTAEEYLERVGTLPLAHQPGERWMYHTSCDVLGILLARVSEKSLAELLFGTVTGPLGLSRTGFFTEETLPTAYRPNGDGLQVAAEYDGAFSAPPLFESLGGGLVSTAPEFLAILAAIADGELVANDLATQATTAQLDAGQQLGLTQLAGSGVGWGWCVSVDIGTLQPWSAPGRWGWNGGSGTSAYVDPTRDLVGVVMSQRFMAGPREPFDYFWMPLAASVDHATSGDRS